jgi:hypothetical protein
MELILGALGFIVLLAFLFSKDVKHQHDANVENIDVAYKATKK